MGKFGNCCCVTVDCACIEVPMPDAEISGYTGGGWESDFVTCCFDQTFTPNASTLTKYCSPAISEYSITKNCTVDYYFLKRDGRCTTYTAFPGCPLPEDDCCGVESWVVGGSSSSTATLTIKTYLVAYNQLQQINVYVHRGPVLCSGVEVCKWIVLIEYVINYRVGWTYDSEEEILQTVTANTCFESNEAREINCTKTKALDCDDVLDNLKLLCWTQGTVKLHRVKFFDSFPAGSHSFTDADVPGTCLLGAEGLCGSDPFNWASQVCIETDVLCPPYFCQDPPIVTTTPTTYTVSGYACTSYELFTDCAGCESVLAACTSVQTCPEQSITLDCDTYTYPWLAPDYAPDCEGCSWFSNISAPVIWGLGPPESAIDCIGTGSGVDVLCGCSDATNVITAPACSNSTSPCEPCCNDCTVCPGCPRCENKHTGTLARSSDVSFTINCADLIAVPDYCFSPPPVTVVIDPLP